LASFVLLLIHPKEEEILEYTPGISVDPHCGGPKDTTPICSAF